MAKKFDRPMSVYEVATAKGVGVQTVRNAKKAGRIKPAFTMPVGKDRSIDMFLPSDIEGWQPGQRGRVSYEDAYKLLPQAVRDILSLDDFRAVHYGIKGQE